MPAVDPAPSLEEAVRAAPPLALEPPLLELLALLRPVAEPVVAADSPAAVAEDAGP